MAARSWFGICAFLAASFALALGCREEPNSETQVMLAVAASLRNVTPELMKAHAEKHPGVKVSATYGASGDLRKQVEGGAPIDAVIFASNKPVDDLIRARRADGASRKIL